MSAPKVKITLNIIRQHFGKTIEEVAHQLIINGPLTLKPLCYFSKKPIHLVKESLKCLIQHNLVKFEANSRDQIEYRLLIDNVISMLRYSKYILVGSYIDLKFGEHLVEELLKIGKLSLNDLIEKLTKKLSDQPKIKDKYQLPKMIYDAFVKFVNQDFIINTNQEIKTVPVIDFKKFHSLISVKKEHGAEDAEIDNAEAVERPTKKLKTNESDESTMSSDCWYLNFEKFEHHLRGDMVAELIRSFYDDINAGEIAKLIYLNMDKGQMITRNQIVTKALDQDICDTATEVDVYLRLFDQDLDNRFIYRVESTGDGGRFTINAYNVFHHLIKETFSTIVNNYYGDKSSRIFRLLLLKKYLQQKQIGELAMISVKDAKERLSTLFKDGLVRILQFTKAPDYAPMKTSFVVTVDLNELCLTFKNKCYHSLYSIACRRDHEYQTNRTLIEKKILVDAIIENLKGSNQDDQMNDLDQTFSTHEQQTLKKYDMVTKKIEHCELEIDRTLFLIDTYLEVCKTKAKTL